MAKKALQDLIRLNSKQTAQLLVDIIKYTPRNAPYPVVMLCGPTGGGKTTFVQDLGRSMSRPVVVCELAGMEPPDIVGLPAEKDGICVFAKPWWFNSLEDTNEQRTDFCSEWIDYLRNLVKDIPEEQLPDRILFMDELNRAHPDTQNPVMNILLECRHQGEYMKYRTLIIGAGNLNTSKDDYNVNEFGTAVKDRVRMIEFRPTFSEWVQFCGDRIHPGIISYVEKNKSLIRNFDQEKGIISLRTIYKVGEMLNDFPVREEPARAKALIGAFLPVHLVQNVYTEVVNTVDTISPEDILSGFTKNKNNVAVNLQRAVESKRVDILNVVVERTYDELLKCERVSKKLVNNVLEFIKALPKPIAFAFVCKIRDCALSNFGSDRDKMKTVQFANRLLTELTSVDDYLLELTKLDKTVTT